jgi:hypothetical protein
MSYHIVFHNIPNSGGRCIVRLHRKRNVEISAAVEADRHATRTAAKLGISYAAVWRIAHRESIELTVGKAAKGRKGVSRAAVIAAGLANPQASQAEIARALGTRETVARLEGGRRRRGVRGLKPG